jgi:hypothetical protein
MWWPDSASPLNRNVEPVEKVELQIGCRLLKGRFRRVLGMLPAPVAGLMGFRDCRFLR